MIIHWLNVEFWSPMWPNVFSPNVWTIAAIVLHLAATLVQRERQHREAEKRADERQEDMKQHVTKTASESEGT
jgi:hypothetical protein